MLVFTSPACASCEPALEVVERMAGQGTLRRFDFGEHPEVLRRAGVEAVPVTVVVGAGGQVVTQLGGVPSRWRLRRALRAAGLV